MTFSLTSIPIALAALLLLGGCAQTQPSRFYVLTPESKRSDEQVQEVTETIGLRLMTIPAFMDRPHITERLGDNEVRISQFNRWAGSLTANISQVMAENLAADMHGARIIRFPWSRARAPSTVVQLSIQRFDGETEGQVFLKAAWNVTSSQTDRTQHSGEYSTLAEGSGYTGLVFAMSELLTELSADIAKSVK